MPNALAKLGDVKPATRARATEFAEQFPKVTVMWGFDPTGSEHGTGRALDIMVFQDNDLGNEIANYLWTHRSRLDLTHQIWRQRIRSTVKRPGVWRNMEDRGNRTKNHFDHVHVLFGKGAYVARGATGATRATATAAATILAPTGPKYPGVELRPGSSGPHVTTVQRRLKERGWTITVNGTFDSVTEKVVRKFQENKGLKANAVVGPITWAALWNLPVT